jgi:hypothetical protein
VSRRGFPAVAAVVRETNLDMVDSREMQKK